MRLHQLIAIKQRGIVKTYETEYEKAMPVDVLDEWPAERIAALPETCKINRTRLTALLGITAQAFAGLASGDYTPTPGLCDRMAKLQASHDSGELHKAEDLILSSAEMRRRMAVFRSWFLSKPATEDCPTVNIEVTVRWGPMQYQQVRIPIDSLPKFRLRKWSGLAGIARAIKSGLSQLNQDPKFFWTHADQLYWQQYANDSLPEIVTQRRDIPARGGRAKYERRKVG